MTAVWNAARPPFLLLTPVAVLAGWGGAWHSAGDWQGLDLLLVLAGAMAAHVAVNALNEYDDFRSGLDTLTTRTPFSGGSGLLPRQPEYAPLVLGMAIAMILVVAAVGLWFLWRTQLALLPLGLLGLALILSYTRYLSHSPWLCLLAPGTGFGLLMVTGTERALSDGFSPAGISAGLIVFFLVNNLLLLNQFPDVDADRQVGRRHLLIHYGHRTATRVFAAQMLAAYGVLVAAVALQFLPYPALAGLLTAPAAFWCARQLQRFATQPQQLRTAMATNVVINLLTPLLITAGLVLA